jgi:hypothetical protein
MVETKTSAYEGIGQNLAKVVQRLGLVVDDKMGKTGLKPHSRPSTWINTLGALAGIVGPIVMKTPLEPYGEIAKSAGWHFMTKWWDYGEEYIKPTTVAAAAAPGRVVIVPPTRAAAPAAPGVSMEL